MHSCSDIAYRSVTSEQYPVQGIHIIRARREMGLWKVSLAYDEINTAADLADLGVDCRLLLP
jgi:hypothetical protein